MKNKIALPPYNLLGKTPQGRNYTMQILPKNWTRNSQLQP